MEEAPATQEYVVAPADPIYHLALNDRLTLCMLWVHGEPDQRRLVKEKPRGQFTALCRRCEEKAMQQASLSS